MDPTILTAVRDLFSASGKRAEIRWDELVAWFVVMLRAERDAAFEVGKEMCRRMLRDIAVVQDTAAIIQERKDLTTASIDANRVLSFSRSIRRVSARQSDVILAGIEDEGAVLATDLLEAGSKSENTVALMVAGRKMVAALRDYGDVVGGAQGWLDALASLPPVDAAYMANVVARSLMEKSWDLDRKDERRTVIASTVSALAITRLLRKSPVPDDIVATGAFQPTGACDPAESVGQNSGPHRVVLGSSDVLSATAGPNQTDSVTMPGAKLEAAVYLAMTRTDGYYHFSLAPGSYTVDMAAAVAPGATVTVQLVPLGQLLNMSVTTPAAVAAAINAAAIPGVFAAPYQPPGFTYASTVEIKLSPPASGPSGWLVFMNPSNQEFWSVIGFPSLYLTTQSMTAGQIAAAYNAAAEHSVATAKRTELLSGGGAQAVSATEISVSKGSGLIVLGGNRVTTGQILLGNPWGLMAVGDECVLIDINSAYSIHVIVEIGDGWFDVDGTPLPTAVVGTINPVLSGYESGVDFTLDLGTRQYQFGLSDWARATSPGFLRARIVDLSPRGHYDVGQSSYRVYQERFALKSRDTTTASQITPSAAGLGGEIGLAPVARWAVAYQTNGSFTKLEAQRCLVRKGDTVEYTGGTTQVTGVDDDVVSVSPGIGISGQTLTLTFRNPHRAAWVSLLSAIELPSNYADALAQYEALIGQLATTPTTELAAQLALLAQQPLNYFATLEPVIAAYTEREMSTKAASSILRAFRSISAWKFYDRITKGQLDVLLSDPRDATREGYAARLSGDTGRGLKTGLTPTERYVLEGIGRAGRG